MGEPDDLDIDTGEDVGVDEAPSEGFSIGKLIEWLLANMIPVIVAVVLSTIIAIILVRTNVSKKSEEQYQTVKLRPKPPPKTIFPLGDFKLNTADINEPHFIRLTISLGYDGDNKQLITELANRKVQIRDKILYILSSKTKDDIDSASEKEFLKEEIKKSINNIMTSGEIEAVYYDEFVIS